jgi:outer membrane lipoprotein SlyB
MLSRLLVVGVLSGAGLGGFLGQAGGASDPLGWATIAGGAVGGFPPAAVLAWRLNKQDKDVTDLRTRENATQAQLFAVIEKQSAVIADATHTLADVRAGMEATIDRTRPSDLQRVMRQLHDLTETMDRDRRGRNDPDR